MNLLSSEAEKQIINEVSKIASTYDAFYKKADIPVTGLISQQKVQNEFEIDYKTLLKWEKYGLKRYIPPIENSRKVYYKITDVMAFLGVEN